LKLIVGIGNPGAKYLNTKHNIGFQILDLFCEKHNLNFQPTKSNFWIVESNLDTFHFFLVKPATYVNNSGLAVKNIFENSNIDLSNLLVVYDDTNLETGEIRIRKSGGDGGHNGIKSIIYHLENNNFMRLRIGVGKPDENENLADYVLSDFNKNNIKILNEKSPLIISLIEEFIKGGATSMLNYFSKESNISSSNFS